ncbi:MAG: VanZ family protein [Erysipelotrichaceae bacterium]|nr:VanZ family protein [Erysipelotrichaceae bacterium]
MIILTIIWFVFMTYLSHQDGEHTGKMSRSIAELFIGHYGDIEELNIKLRKLAHIFVFFILSVLVLLTVKSWYVLIVLCVWAFVDEATKPWIQGRHFSLFDVSLNLVGVVIGLLFIKFFS